MLPTGTVLSAPGGRPVLVGGPPAPFAVPMTTEALMEALENKLKDKLFSGALRKVAKLTNKKRKRISDLLHERAGKILDRYGVGDFVRNMVSRVICTLTGHPVDVATGKVLTEQVDFALPGPLPHNFERVWYSTSTYRGPLGHGWHHNYDMALLPAPEDNLIVLRTADGRYVPFPALKQGQTRVDDTERLSLYREVAGSYILTDADQLKYRFTDVGRSTGGAGPMLMLSSIQDQVGHKVELRYDRKGRLGEIIDSAGRSLTLSYDDASRITRIDAPDPQAPQLRVPLCRYSYDAGGNLSHAFDALGQPMRFRYEKQLLVQETDRNGLSFFFEYDGSDETAKCTRTYGDGGIYDHKLTYKPGKTIVENSLGHRTTYRHEAGLVIETENPSGAITRSEYDPNQLLLRETNELGQATRYEYDDAGNPSTVTAPDGSQVCIAYNDNNRPVEATDEVGGQWRWQYDDYGRLLERKDPLGSLTRFAYSERLLSAVTDPAGAVTSLMHDRAGNLVQLREPSGATRQWSYDGWGRPLKAVDPHGNTQERRYDLLSRVTHISEPDGNQRSLRYDAESNLLHLHDLVQDVSFAYQGMGRLISRTQAGTTVRFEYDKEEQLTAIVNEQGFRYTFDLDANGQVKVESGFDGLTRRYYRDLAGRVIAVTRPNNRTTGYSYDAAGRVTHVKHWERSEEHYSYREDGLLLSAKNNDSEVRFERDLLGRITKEIQGDHWVESRYDSRGLRSHMQSSMGADVAITRNAMGDVTGVREAGGFSAHITRDQLGLEVERILPGGLRRTWQRDRLGRPIQHEIRNGKRILRAASYTWKTDDRITSILDSLAGHVEYSHNALGYLEWARYSDGTEELRMPDAVGNLFKTKGRTDRKYGPAGQLLESKGKHGTTFYTYDAEGNLIEKKEPLGRTWHYAWNPDGTLREVTRPDGTCVTFKYDALARRTEKTYRGQTTKWVWDGNVPLHEWVEGNLEPLVEPETPPIWSAHAEIKRREAELQTHLLRGPPDRGTAEAPITWLFDPESFAPMARLQGGEHQSILCDHLGTPIAVVDAKGETVWQATLDTYGEVREVEGERGHCPFRFPGQYEDAEAGLHYNRFRYYDPGAGSYFSQDPVSLLGGFRPFGFVHDSLCWSDPLGLAKRKKRCGGRKVYREISAEDAANLSAGRGLVPKGTSGDIADHIQSRPTAHVSASLTAGGTKRFRSGNGLVEIDVDKAEEGGARFVDHNNVMQAARRSGDSRAVRDAKRAEEVLFLGEVPADAITIIG